MSTRVLPVGGYINYIKMSELRRRLQPPPITVTQPESSQSQDQAPLTQVSQMTPAVAIHPTRSVRRNLFGPIDHEENLKFVHEELNKISEADSRRWNFDFKHDRPLEGRFTWETAAGAAIPSAYEMPNLTSKLTQVHPAPSTSKMGVCSKVFSAAKVSEALPAENPLRTALDSVTTASTTVLSTTVLSASSKPLSATAKGPSLAPTEEPSNSKPEAPSKEGLEPRPPLPKNSTDNNLSSKQTQITDFFQIRKRARSPSDSDAKTQDASALPLLKRARTST